MLICFTGIDGSGKTTHANLLIKALRKRGHPCTYVWAAERPIFSYIFYGLTRLLGYWREIKRDAYMDPLELAPPGIRDKFNLVWLCFLFLDFQIKTLFKVRIPLFFKKIVICDRYVYDLLMELMLSRQYSDRFCKLLLQTLPKPRVTFLMDVSEKLAHERHGVSANILRRKRNAYLILARNFGFYVLKTNESLFSNNRLIREKVFHELI